MTVRPKRELSAEHKAKLSAAMRGRKCRPEDVNSRKRWGLKPTSETRTKLSQAAKKYYADTQLHPLKIAIATGTNLSLARHAPEARAKMSASRTGMPARHARRVQYNGRWFRSRWEVAVAEALDARRIAWEYEPKSYFCGDGSRYTPDFYLPGDDCYWEVKGWFTKRALYKISEFRRLQTQPLVVIGASALAMLVGQIAARRLRLRRRALLSGIG